MSLERPVSPGSTLIRTSSCIHWRQEYLHISLVIMSACWLAGWVALTLRYFVDIAFPTALGLSVVHVLISMLVVRWMLFRRLNGGLILATISLLMWLAALFTILITPALVHAYGGHGDLSLGDLFHIDEHERVPGGPIIIFWVLLLWWRGYQLGSTYLTLVRASFGMRLGILAFVWLAIFSGRDLRQDALAVLPFFFFFGLLASSLARADSLNLDRAGRSGMLGRGWIISLVGIALLVTFGGYIATLWFTGLNMALAAEVLRIIAQAVVSVVLVLLAPLFLIMQVLYNILDAILPDRMPGTRRTADSSKEGHDTLQLPWLSEIFHILSEALVIGLIIFIILAVLAFIWFMFVARARGKEYEDEERETLGTGEVVGNLRQALRDGWRRLAGALGVLRQFGLGRDFFAALTIRRIYARMEKLAGVRGYPRAVSETPYEYRDELGRAFPGLEPDVQVITEAYVAVRYGDVPESDEELNAVRLAWDRLHSSPGPTETGP
jgi:hypothetical protein